jgi:hypothetical protein
MSTDLQKIREDIKKSIEHLREKKKLCPNNRYIANYINGEIAGLGIALHQIDSEIYEAETDAIVKDD